MLDRSYFLDRPANVSEVDLGSDVLAVVFGPARLHRHAARRRERAGMVCAWTGADAHDRQATGMLSAIVAPLAAAGVPVWVVSSLEGDLVLVPVDRLDEASGVLRRRRPPKSVRNRDEFGQQCALQGAHAQRRRDFSRRAEGTVVSV